MNNKFINILLEIISTLEKSNNESDKRIIKALKDIINVENYMNSLTQEEQQRVLNYLIQAKTIINTIR